MAMQGMWGPRWSNTGVGSRSTPCRPACFHAFQLVLLMASMTWPMCYAQQPVEVHVSTGQQLADAVARWGAAGSNVTITVDVPYISMRNASLPNPSSIAARSGNIKPFSQGTLTIRGPPNAITVFDGGMRSNIIPVLSYPAQNVVENLVIINTCDDLLVGGQDTSWGLSKSYPSQTFTNCTIYVGQAMMSLQLYEVLKQTIAGWDGASFRGTELSGQSLSPYEATTTFYEWSLGTYINMTGRSISTPDDPLLTRLKAEGRIMPLQFCNGTLVPPELSEVHPYGPLLVGTVPTGLDAALSRTAAQTVVQLIIKGPPAALLLLKGDYALSANTTYTVASSMLITSNPFPATDHNLYPRVDLKQRAGVFSIVNGSQLILKWLVLAGLAVGKPSVAPPGLPAGTDLLPSVFPLAAFQAAGSPKTWSNASLVSMSDMTLVNPPDDFAALLILAQRQAGQEARTSTYAGVLQRAAQLQAGFTRMAIFSLPDAADGQQALVFRELQGWGVSAAMLRVVPSTPVQLSEEQGPSHDKHLNVVGLAVGLSCGIILLLALLTGLYCAYKHWFQQKTSQGNKAISADWRDANSSAFHIPWDSQAVSQQPSSSGSGGLTLDGPMPIGNARRAGSAGQSSSALQSGLAGARDSQLRLLQSASTCGSVVGAHAVPDAQAHNTMLEQIHELAAQLNQEKDEVILAGVLGRGSSGVVFMGIWKGLQVAVKTMVIHQHAEDAPPTTIMEAAIAASLGHPNVVATYHYDIKALAAAVDAGTSGGLQIDAELPPSNLNNDGQAYKIFLIPELCDMSLEAALNAALFFYVDIQGLDLGAVLRVLLDVATGLAYLHSHNIIHGDLKPENIMLKVDPDSPNGVVAKLADFGLSKKLAPNRTHVSNVCHGTPFYVAPEVALQHKLSPASDVYSFGIVMWSVLTQHEPYVMTAAGDAVPNPMFPAIDTWVPEAAAQLFRRCCCTDPCMRPTVDEVVCELKRIPCDSVPPTNRPATPCPSRRQAHTSLS